MGHRSLVMTERYAHLIPDHTRDAANALAAEVEKKLAEANCGFCVIERFTCRIFDRSGKTLRIEGCHQCGRRLNLMRCIGRRHRFWRRVIVEGNGI